MIEIKNISYAYKKQPILDDINFSIAEGECLAILGKNGAGKSTLIKCISKLLHSPDAQVLINNQNVLDLPRNEIAKSLAYVAQKNTPPHAKVFETVLLGRRPYIHLKPSPEDYQICDYIMERLNLTHYAMKYVDELSGGELQKVMLARALVQQPKLLLLDEPTSNLDPKNQYDMMELIREISRENKIASIVVLHDLNLSIRYCDKFLFLNNQKIHSFGGNELINPTLFKEIYDIETEIIEHNHRKIIIMG